MLATSCTPVYFYEFKQGSSAAGAYTKIVSVLKKDSFGFRSVQRWFRIFEQYNRGLPDGEAAKKLFTGLCNRGDNIDLQLLYPILFYEFKAKHSAEEAAQKISAVFKSNVQAKLVECYFKGFPPETEISGPTSKDCILNTSASEAGTSGCDSTLKQSPQAKKPESVSIVKRVLGRRDNDGRVEYYVSWKGHSSLENTWEPKENLDCPDLIQAYEMEEGRKMVEELTIETGDQRQYKTGFDQGYEPESIVGGFVSDGQIMLFIKWKGVDVASLLPAHVANENCPLLVIKYYEEHLVPKIVACD